MLLWILQPLGLRSTSKTNGMMIKKLHRHQAKHTPVLPLLLTVWRQYSFHPTVIISNVLEENKHSDLGENKEGERCKKKQRVWKKGREENKAGRKGHVFAGEVALREQRGVVLHMRWSCGRRREEDSLERKRRGSCSPELSILYVTCVFVSSTFSGWCTWRRYTTQCFPQCLFSFLFSVVLTTQTKTFSLQ